MVQVKAAKCPRCGIRLHEVPTHWGVWILSLSSRDAYTGLGSLKHCYGKSCKGHTWLEIVEGASVTHAMSLPWVRAA